MDLALDFPFSSSKIGALFVGEYLGVSRMFCCVHLAGLGMVTGLVFSTKSSSLSSNKGKGRQLGGGAFAKAGPAQWLVVALDGEVLSFLCGLVVGVVSFGLSLFLVVAGKLLQIFTSVPCSEANNWRGETEFALFVLVVCEGDCIDDLIIINKKINNIVQIKYQVCVV